MLSKKKALDQLVEAMTILDDAHCDYLETVEGKHSGPLCDAVDTISCAVLAIQDFEQARRVIGEVTQ